MNTPVDKTMNSSACKSIYQPNNLGRAVGSTGSTPQNQRTNLIQLAHNLPHALALNGRDFEITTTTAPQERMKCSNFLGMQMFRPLVALTAFQLAEEFLGRQTKSRLCFASANAPPQKIEKTHTIGWDLQISALAISDLVNNKLT